MSSVSDKKASLRQQIRNARANREPKPAETTRLSEQLGQFCLDGKLKTVAAYLPIDGEPDIQEFLSWALLNDIKLLLPIVSGDDLNWVHFTGKTAVGQLGFEEGAGIPANLETADAAFIPALAVDFSGNRLGKGKGYYDRALASSRVKRIAVVFDDEILIELPSEAHDQKVDAAISPSKLLWFRN